jgi:YD repeat-containing protein
MVPKEIRKKSHSKVESSRKTTFVYDNLNRRTAEQWRDGSNNVTRTISFVFDAAGQLTQASDPAAAYEYGYDVAGRLETESQTLTGRSLGDRVANAHRPDA